MIYENEPQFSKINAGEFGISNSISIFLAAEKSTFFGGGYFKTG